MCVTKDVYLACKRNVNGGVFGFVRYGNVKDVDKLLKAVNNVWFGDWRVVAKASSFDRFGNKRVEGKERGEGEKSIRGDKKIEGDNRKVGGGNGVEGDFSKGGGRNGGEGVVRKEADLVNVVRGEVAGGEKGVHGLANGKEVMEVGVEGKMYVLKYTSTEQDVLWASRGLVATVKNGEAIPVIQRRIFDVGFKKLDILPLGADKVLLRLEDEGDVCSIFNGASDFFLQFLLSSS